MCGLIAWWPAHPDPDDRGYFRKGLERLIPRGPDQEGSWEAPDGSAYLGHRRLRVVGEHGRQPIWSTDGQVAILVNGEFYDAASLRSNAEKKGYTFQTDSDSELLLPLYQEHGFGALEFLEGEFAFVLWDRRQNLVWAVRYRAGVKPLRFTVDARGLAFASEAKALFAAGWKARWDDISLAQALAVQYVHPSRTLFAGVQQLAPGESRVFRKNESGQWDSLSRQWWAWRDPATVLLHKTDEEAEEALLNCLRRAIARRTDIHWPIATHLSGGLDSSAIALLASQMHPGKIHAYTVGFEAGDAGSEVQHDECETARATADFLGIPWTRVDATRESIVEHWGDAVERAEAIGVNGHLVAKWLMAKRVHEDGFRVSLSGEGADEALLGYAFLTAESGLDMESIKQANPVAIGAMLPSGEQLDLSIIKEKWGVLPVWLQAKASLGARLEQVLQPDWIDRFQETALTQWSNGTAPPDGMEVHKAASSWAQLALGGYILPALADAPEAGFGIEGRVPFLDRDLLGEISTWHPSSTGWPQTTKKPLRSLLEKQGLHDVASRAKHPFEAPPLWGHAAVRQTLRYRWSRVGAWDGTPIDQSSLMVLMDYLDGATAVQWQLWEPVISTLLSIDHIQDRFNMGPCDV